jgi:hypothetical protein
VYDAVLAVEESVTAVWLPESVLSVKTESSNEDGTPADNVSVASVVGPFPP